MKLKAAVLVPLAAGALVLTGCSTDSTATETAVNTSSCAPTPEKVDGAPDWTVNGTEGKALFTVTDDKTNAAPKIQLTTPFKVDKTQVKTLIAGSGELVTESSTAIVCYEGVNGRDGKVFDSAYQSRTPAPLPASRLVPGFTQALVGQKVGSTVAVVITSADGYAEGNPDAGIEPGDTIVFGLKILAAQ
ncbi:peptidylprolyl isomerase [Gordonia phthalatica]|uniref:Peptidyl-prolyl cis-trans isomerase n=2 Tax=Gordonia phthalatica TaxID=1136941 RepID=A0A0N7FVD7_9ACTN|nr:peptidylprolyl isomerase [Gordonia phthalatica]